MLHRVPSLPTWQAGWLSIHFLVKDTLRSYISPCAAKDPPLLSHGIFEYFMVQSQGWGRRLRHDTITVVSRTPLVEPCWLPKYMTWKQTRPGKTEECWRARSSSYRMFSLPAGTQGKSDDLIVADAVCFSDVWFPRVKWFPTFLARACLNFLKTDYNLSPTNAKLNPEVIKRANAQFNTLLLAIST